MTASIKGHIVICEFGCKGRRAAHRLLSHHRPFLVIEQIQDLIQG